MLLEVWVELELTALQTVQALLTVGHRLEGDLVEVRQLHAVLVLLPVVRVLHGGEVIVDDPLLEAERSGTDEVLGAVGARVELGLGDNPEPALDHRWASKACHGWWS